MKKSNSNNSKAKVAASSVAALMVPQAADAAVVFVYNNPVSVAANAGPSTADWNIDGTGGREFHLYTSTSTTGEATTSYYAHLCNCSDNGVGLVAKTGGNIWDFQNLPANFVVGPTLKTSYTWNSTSTYRTVNTSSGVGFAAKGFTAGTPGYIGFSFDPGDGLHYGFAQLLIFDDDTGFEITFWAYETDINTALTVIPEPADHAVWGLGALAMGIAGVRRWKKAKAARASEEKQ